MISLPITEKVIVIGGLKWKSQGNNVEKSSDILELSGDSEETLEWKILEQKLQYPRNCHVSFSISNDIAATLTTKSIGFSVQN